MKNVYLALGVMALCGLLQSCSTSARPQKEQTLQLWHINDTHSHIEADAASVNIAGLEQPIYTQIGGMPRLAQYVEQQIELANQQQIPTLFLHAGDAFKGSGYFEVHQDKVNSQLLNALGIQAMVLGNHEFDAGLEALARFSRETKFPILAANVDAQEETLLAKAFAPYVLFRLTSSGAIERQADVTPLHQPSQLVAVVGLALETMPQISTQTGKLRFESEIATAQKYINMLEQQGVNKIILLTHLGFERDLALAEALDGVDVIVGGHSHTHLADLTAWGKGQDHRYAIQVPHKTRPTNSCVVTAGQFTHLFGMLTVKFDNDGHLISCQGSAQLLAATEFFHHPTRKSDSLIEDPQILKQVAALPNTQLVHESQAMRTQIEQGFKPAVVTRYGAQVATLPLALPHVRLPGSEGSDQHGSRLAPVIAKAMLQYVNQSPMFAERKADVALMGAGSVRASLEAGDIFEGHILLDVLPYETALTVLSVKGADLRKLLHEVIEATLPTGAHAGKFPYVAGLRYVAIETPNGNIKFETLDIERQGHWQALDDSQTYRVVTTEYLANGKDGWHHLAQSQLASTDRVDLSITADKLQAWQVRRLHKIQEGDNLVYQAEYEGEALSCANKPAGLSCGTQNQAVLEYFRHLNTLTAEQAEALLSQPAHVTLQRYRQN